MTTQNPVLEEVQKMADLFQEQNAELHKENDELKSRIEMMEALADRPRGPGGENNESQEQKEYREAFLAHIRKPHDLNRKARLDEIKGELEGKDVTIGTNSEGGYGLPKQIGTDIDRQMHDLNPFRQIVRVRTVATSDYQELVAENDNTAGWVAETGTRSATSTPTFRNRKPTWGELYAYLQVSNWALEDLFFDVGAFLAEQTSRLFAQMEGAAIVSGNGTAQPTGFLNGTTVTTDDDASPQRSEEVLEYIGAGVSPLAVSYDGLVDLMTAVHEGYLASPNCAWVMRRATLAVVRKLKDSTGQPLWQPSMQAGQPSLLMGYPVYTSEAMPAYSAGNDVIAFGDWNSAYLLTNRTDTQITVDQVTNPGHTRFYVRRRAGGIVLNNDAVKTLKLA